MSCGIGVPLACPILMVEKIVRVTSSAFSIPILTKFPVSPARLSASATMLSAWFCHARAASTSNPLVFSVSRTCFIFVIQSPKIARLSAAVLAFRRFTAAPPLGVRSDSDRKSLARSCGVLNGSLRIASARAVAVPSSR